MLSALAEYCKQTTGLAECDGKVMIDLREVLQESHQDELTEKSYCSDEGQCNAI